MNSTAGTLLNVERIREDFPALHQSVYGKPLIYLDNAATTQKPQAVLDALRNFYISSNSNVHRGIHYLSERATQAYEGARETVQQFLRAPDSSNIIFVRGTTEAINLVAASYGRSFLKKGDEIIISWIEHHSNIVPWQILCEQIGTRLRIIPVNDSGELLVDEYENLLNERVKLVSLCHISNSLGTMNPIKQMIAKAHDFGAVVMIDGAQAAPHLPIDVLDLDCDFYAFSGHKVYGPTGIGVLYGKSSLLDAMPPYQGGGEMISSVSFEKTLYNKLPHKFEAGTPDISGAVGLDAALQYIQTVGHDVIAHHEAQLLRYGTEALSAVPGLKLIGTAAQKASILSFVLEGVHAHDLGTILDREGIAVRAGHHCAMPVMQRFGVPATARASLAMYNKAEEVDALVKGLYRVKELFHA
jgi:cysteine desulfurase/selenocysteine lyase